MLAVLINIWKKISTFLMPIFTVAATIFSVILFFSKRNVDKQLNETKYENRELKLSAAEKEAATANATLKKVEENKAVTDSAQKQVDDAVFNNDSSDEKSDSTTSTPVPGKDFILSILFLLMWVVMSSSVIGCTPKVVTEYVYVKPDYIKLYEIQPKEFSKVTFRAVDDNTYQISYDDVVVLNDRITHYLDVITRLNQEINIYNKTVIELQNKE